MTVRCAANGFGDRDLIAVGVGPGELHVPALLDVVNHLVLKLRPGQVDHEQRPGLLAVVLVEQQRLGRADAVRLVSVRERHLDVRDAVPRERRLQHHHLDRHDGVELARRHLDHVAGLDPRRRGQRQRAVEAIGVAEGDGVTGGDVALHGAAGEQARPLHVRLERLRIEDRRSSCRPRTAPVAFTDTMLSVAWSAREITLTRRLAKNGLSRSASSTKPPEIQPFTGQLPEQPAQMSLRVHAPLDGRPLVDAHVERLAVDPRVIELLVREHRVRTGPHRSHAGHALVEIGRLVPAVVLLLPGIQTRREEGVGDHVANLVDRPIPPPDDARLVVSLGHERVDLDVDDPSLDQLVDDLVDLRCRRTAR